MQATTVTVKNFRPTSKKFLFVTDGKLTNGDSGDALIWKEFGVSVVAGLYCGTTPLPNGKTGRLVLRATDFSTWVYDQMPIAL
jgi:hypothetical protein